METSTCFYVFLCMMKGGSDLNNFCYLGRKHRELYQVINLCLLSLPDCLENVRVDRTDPVDESDNFGDWTHHIPVSYSGI